MSKKATKKELQEKAEALKIGFAEDTTVAELTALIESASEIDLDEEESTTNAAEQPNITLGKRTIQFRQDVKRLQIDGEVHDTSDLLRDKEVMQRLLRGNSPFIEIVKK